MKLSRRRIFELAFGAAQVGLLSSFAPRRAGAQGATEGPTKLLAIWLDGGCHWESFFTPLTTAGVTKFIPGPQGGYYPWGYLPAQVGNFDRSPVDLADPNPVRKIRGPIYWNWNNSADASGNNPASMNRQSYRPHGYSWADPMYRIYERISVLVGADQNTASHQSGIVASMSGVANANFDSPAVQAIIAAALGERFPDRPIPNVSLGGPLPLALGLPSLANPSLITSPSAVEPNLSDRREGAWRGLRTRRDIPELGFDGAPTGRSLPATVVDEAVLNAIRAERGLNAGSDALLEKLYDTYKGASRTIARDVLSVLERATGWEHITRNPRYSESTPLCIGSADTCAPVASMGPFDFALRLLKSDLVSSVTMRSTGINNLSFDTHFSDGPRVHSSTLHITLDVIGRLLIEMSLTPTSAGRTLLDDTQVYVFSDFGRTFPKTGSDHHPATCALLAGGRVRGNTMIGGYDETMEGSPMGVPVPIIEEGGDRAVRTARAQDIAATVIRGFGLEPGRDFFIPGGYGVFDGALDLS